MNDRDWIDWIGFGAAVLQATASLAAITVFITLLQRTALRRWFARRRLIQVDVGLDPKHLRNVLRAEPTRRAVVSLAPEGGELFVEDWVTEDFLLRALSTEANGVEAFTVVARTRRLAAHLSPRGIPTSKVVRRLPDVLGCLPKSTRIGLEHEMAVVREDFGCRLGRSRLAQFSEAEPRRVWINFAAAKYEFFEEYRLPGSRFLVCRVGNAEVTHVDAGAPARILRALSDTVHGPGVPQVDATGRAQIAEWMRRPGYRALRTNCVVAVYSLMKSDLAETLSPGEELRLAGTPDLP